MVDTERRWVSPKTRNNDSNYYGIITNKKIFPFKE